MKRMNTTLGKLNNVMRIVRIVSKAKLKTNEKTSEERDC